MLVEEVMTEHVSYIPPTMPLNMVAKKMRDMDCGFLPVSDADGLRLQGVITDRDITVRAVAEDFTPSRTPVGQVLSDKVLYCFAKDDVQTAAGIMIDQKVYRLIVLDNEIDKNLFGVLTLGDITRSSLDDLGSHVAKSIISGEAA